MKKFLALLCTMAMVLSMFSGIALAAGNGQVGKAWAAIYYGSDSYREAGRASQIRFAVKGTATAVDANGYPTAGSLVNKVEIDFSQSNLTIKDAGYVTTSPYWKATIRGKVLTYEWVGPAASRGYSWNFRPNVVHPSTVEAITWPTVTVYDDVQTSVITPDLVDWTYSSYPRLKTTKYQLDGVPSVVPHNKDYTMTGTLKIQGVLTTDLVKLAVYNVNDLQTPIAETITNDGNYVLSFIPEASIGTEYRLYVTQLDKDDPTKPGLVVDYKRFEVSYDMTSPDLGTLDQGTVKSLSGIVKDWNNGDSVNVSRDTYRVVLTQDMNGNPDKRVMTQTQASTAGSYSLYYKFDDRADYNIGIIEKADKTAITSAEAAALVGKVFPCPGLMNSTLNIGGVDYVYREIKSIVASVSAKGLNVTVDTTSLNVGVPADVKVTVKNTDGTVAVGANRRTMVQLTQNGAKLASATVTDNTGEYTFRGLTVYTTDTVKVTAISEDLSNGDSWYEYGYGSSYADYSDSSKTITVNDKEKLNVSISPSKIVAGKETTVTLNVTTDADNTIDSYTVAISGLAQTAADVIQEEPGVELKDGKIKVTKVGGNLPQPALKFDPEVAGNVTITVTATYSNASTLSKSVTLKVDGYNMTTTGSDAYAGQTKTLSFALTNVDGAPVNNAAIKVEAKELMGSSSSELMTWKDKDGYTQKGNSFVLSGETLNNINNGTYSRQVTFNRAATITVTAYKADTINLPDNQKEVYAGIEFTVYGTPDYTATPDKTTVVAGLKDTVSFTLKDNNGNDVSNAVVKVEAVKPLKDNTDYEYTYSGATTSNGVTTYKLSNFIGKKTGQIKITASEPSTGAKMGTFLLNVVAPKLAEETKVTDGFKHTFSLKIVDPRNGNPISGKLEVGFEGANVKNIWDAQDHAYFGDNADRDSDGWILSDKLPKALGVTDSQFTFTVLATDKKETGEAVAPKMLLSFWKDGDVWVDLAPVEFGAATITATPDTVTADVATNVTITLANAAGKGIADTAINLVGQEIGKTDANGQVTYVVKPQAYGQMNITATTDLDKTVTGKLVVSADTAAPVLTINVPETVKTNSVVVSGAAKDNVKVDRVYVNNQPVMVIPGAEASFDFEVALRPGVNTIKVFAFDVAGNATQVTKTVTYVLPTVVKMAVGSADATINGQAATGAASYIKAGSTMVPFRFIAEALGATVDYNAATSTVTMKLENNTVVLTIGSTTAMVNGTAKTLTVAPEINNGRTMVPLRFVSEALGAQVDWNAATSGITITR